MTIELLNSLSTQQASLWFEQACAAPSWIAQMTNDRPYNSINEVTEHAKSAWKNCTTADFLEAFKAHPMIGDIESLRKKYANTKQIAHGEQSGTNHASEDTLRALKTANQDYLTRHGFIFIICATGLSADAMLEKLLQRINNSTEEEIQNAANEQLKITLLRLNKALKVKEALE